MRWPLKNQIFIRLLVLLLATIMAITLAFIRTTMWERRSRESSRLQEIRRVLTSTRFPLTSSVLDSMSSLSGAEFIVADREGKIVASTRHAPRDVDFPRLSPAQQGPAVPMELVAVDGRKYLYAAVSRMDSPDRPERSNAKIHVLVPQQDRWALFWNASRLPLAVAAVVLPVSLLISLALASQVTRPLARLQEQVQEIARGNITQIAPLSRNDEIHDLNVSVNEMASRLQAHEQQIRQTERLRTLLQIGSGLAHNLRNSATGCRMALEHLASEQSAVGKLESMEVAQRQLSLMESYIQRFLNLAQSDADAEPTVPVTVDLSSMMERVLFMLGPSAAHLNVKLTSGKSGTGFEIRMREDDALQLMTNLIMNAVTAAGAESLQADCRQGRVQVELAGTAEEILFTVTDNGAGPPDDLAEILFEPFVSGRPEGTGLGLCLVQGISQRAGGQIAWERSNGQTVFTFKLEKNRKPRPHV